MEGKGRIRVLAPNLTRVANCDPVCGRKKGGREEVDYYFLLQRKRGKRGVRCRVGQYLSSWASTSSCCVKKKRGGKGVSLLFVVV